MELKITKIGGSNYIIVPHEFIKVYGLENTSYKIEVINEGKTLIYRQVSEIQEQENIPQEKIDEMIADAEKEENAPKLVETIIA